MPEWPDAEQKSREPERQRLSRFKSNNLPVTQGYGNDGGGGNSSFAIIMRG